MESFTYLLTRNNITSMSSGEAVTHGLASKSMKKNILLLILTITVNTLLAQHSFFKCFDTPTFECGFSVVQMFDGGFLITGEIADSYYGLNNSKGYLLKIDDDGNVIGSTQYHDSSNRAYFTIIKQLPENPDYYMVIGAIDSTSGNDVYNEMALVVFNDSLQMVSDRKFPSEKNLAFYPQHGVISYDSVLLILSSVYKNNVKQVGLTKIALPFDSICSYITSSIYSSIPQDLIYDYSTDRVLIFYLGNLFMKDSFLKILKLNSNLNYMSSEESPISILTTACADWLNDTSYVLTGATYNGANPTEHIVTGIIDNNSQVIKTIEYGGENDTILYGGAGTNTMINNGMVFITGMYNFDPTSWPWQSSPTWIQVTKMDTELNIQSQHYYGGDAEYTPYCIIPCSDGGAFITGFTWDYNTPGNELWHIFALKVDSMGVVTNIPDDASWSVSEAIVCPNPGNEYFTALVGVQYKTALLHLYDIQGRLLMEKEIRHPRQKIDVSFLPTGVYVYKFISSGKSIGGGKWVKQ